MPLVKRTWNQEYGEGEDQQGEWQSKVVSIIWEMGCHPSRSIEDVVQIHPRMNREEWVGTPGLHLTGADLQASGMAPALLSRVFQLAKLYRNRD